MLAALGNPGVGIVQRVHQPEDEAVKGFLLRQAKLFNDADFFPYCRPRWLTQLLEGQLEVRNVARLDADELAADKINGQALASRDQNLQIGLVTIERPLAILSHAAIDDGQVGPNAKIHIHDGLVDAEGMHGPPVGTGQNTHRVFHR